MRATLIHNARAGGHRVREKLNLVRALEDLGWEVTALDRSELERAFASPGEVVVVAGGDGTVGEVSKRFAGTGVPIAVIPTGTANNVARTLGIGVDPRFAVASLAKAVIRDVDLGVVSSGRAYEERFIEGFGVGVFAYVMAERATKEDKSLRRAFALLAEEVERYEPFAARVEVEGEEVSGEYILVAVLNLRSLGPALSLAPDAQLDDGKLNLVLVRPDHRASFAARLRATRGGDIVLPEFEVHRAKHVLLRVHADRATWAHVDDCSRELGGEIEVQIEPRAARFLVPAPPESAAPPRVRHP